VTQDPSSTPGTRAPRRRRVAVTFAGLMATLGVTAAACGGSSGPSEGALAGKSATAVLSTSIKAYHEQSSVSFVTKTVVGKTSTVQVGATSNGAATESVRAGTTPIIDAVLVDGTAYLRAGTQFLEQELSLSTQQATQYAGQWISFKKGDPGFSTISTSLGASDAIYSLVPEDPNLRVVGAASFSKHQVIAVSGSPASSPAAGDTAKLTMFVSTTAPYLPLGATLNVTDGSGKTVEQVAAVFGRYNAKVAPKAPTDAVPITSLTA